MHYNLTKEKESLFRKYAVFYDLSYRDYINEIKNSENSFDWARVKIQKEVYGKLCQEGDDRSLEGLRRLISITEKEIQMQYARKEHFENRTGFLMAFLGIIVGSLISRGHTIITSIETQNSCVILNFLSFYPSIEKSLILQRNSWFED